MKAMFNFKRKLIFPLFFSFTFYIKHYFNVPSTKVNNGSLFTVIFYSIGLLIALIPYFMTKYETRDDKSMYINMSKAAQGLIFTRVEDKNEYNFFFIKVGLIAYVCISSAMIQFIQSELISSEMWVISNACLSMLGTYITVALCYSIFKTQIYRHKIVALVLLIAVSAILGYFFIRTLIIAKGQIAILIYIILLMILEPLRGIVEKILMEFYLMNRFLIMILEGIFGLLISGLVLLILFLCKYNINFFELEPKSFNEGIKWNNWIEIIFFVGFSFVLCHLRLTSNDYFHPLQRYSFDSIPYFILAILFAICCIFENNKLFEDQMKQIFLYFGRISYANNDNIPMIVLTLILDISLSIVWLFSTALLNEILILKCWHMDAFTTDNIGDRGEKEVKENQIDIFQLNKDNDSIL